MRAFTGKARLPLEGAAVTITDSSGNAVAMRLTNRSGALDAPIEITVPERSESLSPDTSQIPYSTLNLYARSPNYETIEVENLQVFPGTLTVQALEMIPLAEFPDSWNRLEIFNTPPQNL